MKRVLTSFDLQDVAPGGELVLGLDTLVTPLARDEAERRGIALRTAAAPSSTDGVSEGVVPGGPWIAGTPAVPSASLTSDDGLIVAVTEEVIAYLSDQTASQLVPGPAERRDVSEESPNGPAAGMAPAAVAALIDHALLKADALPSDIEQLCREAVQVGFVAVCVNPWHVSLAVRLLQGSAVKVCTVVGFPLGANLPQIKMREAEEAIKLGAQEIDVVQNVGALKSGQDELVEAELRGVVELSHRAGAICKVILEMSLLSREEKIRAALLAKRVGADFVKTSTGFALGGATAEDVALLRETVGAEMGIKASGGIRTLSDLSAMVGVGATRIGTSSGVKIVAEARARAKNEGTPSSTGASGEDFPARE